MKKGKKAMAAVLAAAMLWGGAVPAEGYSDYGAVTWTGIDLTVPSALNIVTPGGDVTTAATHYYLTGTSDPGQHLYLNGEEISTGRYGSWGAYLPLDVGKNTFEVAQGGRSDSVTIRRVASAAEVPAATTSRISSLKPANGDVAYQGEEYELSCVAPSGAEVWATAMGKTVALKQVAAASPGVPAVFKGKVTPSGYASGAVTDAGTVQYGMTWNGAAKYAASAGKVYVAGQNADVAVRVNDTAVTVYAQSNTDSQCMTTLRLGATDYIVGQTASMYQLAMGGWINKDVADVAVSGESVYNKVSSVRVESREKGERFVFSGTGQPVFTASSDSEKVTVKLMYTTGISAVDASQSSLIRSVKTIQGDDGVTLEFYPAGEIGGYNVEFENNNTVIYIKKKPVLSGSSSQPLKGITVALDAGHGGSDPGALGTAGSGGPTEKQITLSTAIAVKNRLESLGAQVLMTRAGDTRLTFNERLLPPQEQKVDFFLSFHCNSTAAGANGTKAKGVEIYYYEGADKAFAQTVLNKFSSYTGRSARGVYCANYRVALATYCPSILVEMGFMPNPVEYDDMCSDDALFATANAIGDSLIAYLS
ncbi:MAG: N-acetylmuramoyl-L-alanine amidase [Oscillospiraceae bacterium]|nr:N-acetylmuramoyl-L-alanine amidase [Oscillospiraceae bacterium]